MKLFCLSLVVALACLSCVSSTFGHSEPPPPPPPEHRVVHLQRVKPLRWSWLHWWEANRDPYIYSPNQATGKQTNDDTVLRAKVVAALLEDLGDQQESRRWSCAYALGLMEEPSAVEFLIRSVEKDPSEEVRFIAILALGMIGNEEAETFLQSAKYPSDYLKSAGLIALVYTKKPSEKTRQGLSQLLYGIPKVNQRVLHRSPALSNAAMWSLKFHPPDEKQVVILRNIIQNHPSMWQVSDAILTLGRSKDPKIWPVLSFIAMDDPKARQLHVYNTLFKTALFKEKTVWSRDGNSKADINTIKQWADRDERIFMFDPTPKKSSAKLGKLKESYMVRGMERVFLARLRTSAVMALGQYKDAKSNRLIIKVLNAQRNADYDQVPKSFALIELGKNGFPESLPHLLAVLDPRQGGKLKSAVSSDSPLRGFAAIGLGLYARVQKSPQGNYDRPEYQKAVELLFERLLDINETLEVRTACALAIGLTKRTENLKPFLVNEQLLAQKKLVWSYVLLARAMLGDGNILSHVQTLLAEQKTGDEVMFNLTRRAAVLSLGVLGSREVIPTLTKAWHQDYYINREVILSLSLCGASGVGETVLPLLQKSDNEKERFYMAMVLGQLLVKQRPTHFADFINKSNFTLRNGLKLPYQTLANEFLYDFLIPRFKQRWY